MASPWVLHDQALASQSAAEGHCGLHDDYQYGYTSLGMMKLTTLAEHNHRLQQLLQCPCRDT